MVDAHTICAFTPAEADPPYINVSRLADGSIRVVVRSIAERAPQSSSDEGAVVSQPCAEIIISAADWRSMAWEMHAENEDHMRRYGRPVPTHGSGP